MVKRTESKLKTICRTVGADYLQVTEVLKRIKKVVLDEGEEVITHDVGTFYRRRSKPRPRVLNGQQYTSEERYTVALRGHGKVPQYTLGTRYLVFELQLEFNEYVGQVRNETLSIRFADNYVKINGVEQEKVDKKDEFFESSVVKTLIQSSSVSNPVYFNAPGLIIGTEQDHHWGTLFNPVSRFEFSQASENLWILNYEYSLEQSDGGLWNGFQRVLLPGSLVFLIEVGNVRIHR